jgi:hypothetical protein
MADSSVFWSCSVSALAARLGCGDGLGEGALRHLGGARRFGFSSLAASARSRCFRTASKSTSPDGGWGHSIFFCTALRKASTKHLALSVPVKSAKSVLRILSPYSAASSSCPGFMFRGFMVVAPMMQCPRRGDGRR